MSSKDYNNLLSDGNSHYKLASGVGMKHSLLIKYTEILLQNETLQGLIESEIEYLEKN